MDDANVATLIRHCDLSASARFPGLFFRAAGRSIDLGSREAFSAVPHLPK
jgi:hypothetical protein